MSSLRQGHLPISTKSSTIFSSHTAVQLARISTPRHTRKDSKSGWVRLCLSVRTTNANIVKGLWRASGPAQIRDNISVYW